MEDAHPYSRRAWRSPQPSQSYQDQYADADEDLEPSSADIGGYSLSPDAAFDMSPGRRKAVPASLELSRSNLAPFDFQQSVSGQNSASGRRSFTSPSHTSSSAPVPRQPEPPHKAGPSHNSYIAVDSSEDSSDDKMRDKRQNGATRSRNNTDPASSPEMQYSPQDRSRLVGLGELATPKWASQASFSISHSSSGPIEPLPSLLPYDSPAAPSTGQMRISQSLMSLPETSPNQSPDISFNNTPISSSSSYKQHATVQNSPAPSSKSPSAAMSAIDHLLSGEFEDVDCQTDSGDLNASTRQTGTTSQRSHASRQLPQPPQTTTSRKPKSDSMLGLGFELPEGQSGPRTRQPSGPRQPPDSPAQHTTQHLKTPSEPANVFVPSPSRPHMTRQTSSQSQGSDVSHHFGSPPPPIPSPRHAEKSPRTSVHHKRQSAGATSTRSRSSSLHPQSPAHIAHAIMRTANEEGVDVDALAGYDDDTAAALRKLDGLGVSRNRARESTTSTGTHSRRGSVSSLKRSPSTESKHRRPRSKGSESGIKPPPLDPRQAEAIPAVPSPMSASSSPQVSMSMQGQPPSTANKKVRPTSEATLSDHRGSTSSASMLTMGSQTTGTHYATSRDSTSYTSNSVSSPAGRPSSKSGRRSSGGSDLSLSGLSESSAKHNTAPFESSSNSVHRNLAHLDDTSIPPVPPLPKDLESYSQPGSAVKETFKHPLDMQQVQSPVRSISFSVGDDPPLSAVTEVSSSDGSSPVLSTAASLKTPSKKWSISSALHIGRTPSTTSSTSGKLGADSSQPRMTRKSSADSAGGGSFVGSLSSRKSSSSNDIATLATARSRMPHSPSLATIASGSSSRLGSRSRKSSFESTDTAATANQSGISRTSESARKSEGVSSGIPFFARRGSSASQASQNATNSSPELSGKDPKEKSGRKSILGLNFLNRKDRKQLADADVVSPDSSVSATPRQKNRTSRISVRTSATGAELTPTSDASSVRTRLRNKSMSSFTRSEHPSTSAISPKSEGNKGDTSQRPSLGTRSSTSDELSAKGQLPTIAGSPSVQSGLSNDKVLQQQQQAPDPSQTPTRIPRRVGTGSTSPRPSLMSEFGIIDAAEKALNSANSSLQVESENSSRRTSSSASSSRSTAVPKSRSSQTISASAASTSSRTADRQVAAAAPAARHVKRRSLLGSSTEKDTASAAAPLTNRTPARTPRRVSSPATSQQNSASAAPARRTVKSISAATARREANLADDAGKPLRPRVAPPVVPATVSAASKMSKSTTMPSLQVEERKRRESVSAASSRRSTPIDDLEQRADQEMQQYVRRVTSKKLAAGVPSEDIRALFEFPDPTRPTRGMSAKEASALFSRELAEYEREEIKSYDSVYFVGQGSRKVMATQTNTRNNYGYDDDRGDYLVVTGDHILFRYEVMDVLGKGSFGQVLQCRDHRTGHAVAIKIIRNKHRFHKQAQVEIKVLDNLRKWDPDERHNVVMMTDHFNFRGHLCIVTELLSINLYELIKANSFHGFSTTLIRRFAIQMLNSMTLLRHHRVVHCDLKPENVLLMHPCKSAVKVIDFGSSCFENEKVYTYIQSRFYRSIEVILGSNYHMAIDMWSLGCILAEMYTGIPLFPGENEQEQLACIMEVLGMPSKHMVDRCSRRKVFFDSTGAPRPVVNSKGRRRKPGSKSLAQVLKTDDENFIDFIQQCLIFDPDRRMKPSQALRHPFVRAEVSRSSTTPAAATPSSRSAARHSSGNSISISTPKRKSMAHNAPAAPPQTSCLSSSTSSSRSKPSAAFSATVGSSQRFAVK